MMNFSEKFIVRRCLLCSIITRLLEEAGKIGFLQGFVVYEGEEAYDEFFKEYEKQNRKLTEMNSLR